MQGLALGISSGSSRGWMSATAAAAAGGSAFHWGCARELVHGRRLSFFWRLQGGRGGAAPGTRQRLHSMPALWTALGGH